MASLRDIKRRIGSVKNTRQITRAMKLVAAAKMRRAQEDVTSARPYAEKMHDVLNSLASRTMEKSHPLLEKRNERNILIILYTSDKGLCGAFNANLFKATQKLIRENEGKGIYLSVIGKKGRDFFKRKNVIMHKYYVDYHKNMNYKYASTIGKDALEAFEQEKVDRVYIVYNRFISVINQEVIAKPILPVEPEVKAEGGDKVDYLYEPSARVILGDILRKSVEVESYRALLESWASENGSRMAAMDNATRNAGEMISSLTLKYNRARQAAITTELIEIVSGADALKA